MDANPLKYGHLDLKENPKTYSGRSNGKVIVFDTDEYLTSQA